MKQAIKMAFLLPSPAFPGRSTQLADRPPLRFLGTLPSTGPKFPQEPRGTAARKDGSRRSSSPLDFASPPSPSRPSWEPLLRLLSPAALDQARAVLGWAGDGCSLELTEVSVSPEWRVCCHPTLNRTGSSRAGSPSVQHTGKSQNALDWTLSPAQAPSTIPRRTGLEGCPLPRP